MKPVLLRWLQTQLVLCSLATLVLLFLCVEYLRLTGVCTRSQEDRKKTELIAAKIEQIRAEVPMSSGPRVNSDSILSEIRRGLQEANIPETRIGDIRVVGKALIPKTTFAREDTLVSLKSIELGELLTFVQSEESKSGTLCSGLEIASATIAKDESSNDQWDVTLTLTKVIEESNKP